jgi:hypothetical protein
MGSHTTSVSVGAHGVTADVGVDGDDSGLSATGASSAAEQPLTNPVMEQTNSSAAVASLLDRTLVTVTAESACVSATDAATAVLLPMLCMHSPISPRLIRYLSGASNATPQ